MERDVEQWKQLADELAEAATIVRDVMLIVEPLREDNWNPDAHIGLTLTVTDFRKPDAALTKYRELKEKK